MTDVRSMTAEDLPVVRRLLNNVFRLSQGVTDQDVLTDFPLAFAPRNHGNCRIIQVAGRTVSHAALEPCEMVIGAASLKAATIVLVATHPDYRHQGHAAALMRSLQDTLKEEHYDLAVLWTGVPDFYRKLGWEVITPRGWMVEDLRGDNAFLEKFTPTDEATIADYNAEQHLPGVMHLHDQEQVRVQRMPEGYRTLLALPKIRVTVLLRQGQVAAYLAAGQAVNKSGILEYGGAAEDILALTARLLKNNTFNRPLPLLIFPPREDLAKLARKAGATLEPLECSKGRGCEMIYAPRPERVTKEIREKFFMWGLDFT